MFSTPTKFFGELECSEDSIYRFEFGIPGYEAEKSFVFIEQPVSKPLLFMQSVITPDLCFVLLPILSIDFDYRLMLTNEDRTSLQLDMEGEPRIGEDILCAALINISNANGSGSEATANLLAPIVLNLKQRTGMQVIQTQSDYSHRHPLNPKNPQKDTPSCS